MHLKASNMFLTDCHVHLTDQSFQHDLENVINKANTVNITTLIAVAQDSKESLELLQLAKKYDKIIFPCIGLHPVQLVKLSINQRNEEIQLIQELINENCNQIIGIGECGLDYSRHIISETNAEIDKSSQREAFRAQLQLAKHYNLPVNVHSRNAGHYVIELLSEEKLCEGSVLLHAFDGNIKYAKKAVSLGYFFSVPASIARDEQMKKLFAAIPVENLVLETDSPSLPPVKSTEQNPVRNEPVNLLIALKELAKVKNMDETALAAQLQQNAKKLFPRAFENRTNV
jgi:TatD DNase family protein